METNDVRPTGAELPVGGIGGSAAGLLAAEQFLSHLPFNSGIASGDTLGLRTTQDRPQAPLETAKSSGLEDGLS